MKPQVPGLTPLVPDLVASQVDRCHGVVHLLGLGLSDRSPCPSSPSSEAERTSHRKRHMHPRDLHGFSQGLRQGTPRRNNASNKLPPVLWEDLPFRLSHRKQSEGSFHVLSSLRSGSPASVCKYLFLKGLSQCLGHGDQRLGTSNVTGSTTRRPSRDYRFDDCFRLAF